MYIRQPKDCVVKTKWKVTVLQLLVSTLPLSQRLGWGREINPSVNTHPHYTIVPPLCPHHPRSVVKALPVTSPSFHHPCHCTAILLSLLLSCSGFWVFLDNVNHEGGIYAFGWCSDSGVRLHWERASVVLLTFVLRVYRTVFVRGGRLHS